MAASTGSQYAFRERLKEVQNFLRGVTYERQVSPESLAQSALSLLRTVPETRHAVLEHFCNVFDEAVSSHLYQLDMGPAASVSDEALKNMESILQDVSEVLLSFIQNNAQFWAHIISAWSLELLGHISCKYAEKRGIPHSNSLNEVLQLWMTCTPTKILIELATECFAAMVRATPDVCVDSLLEATVKYSPNFDWVVAHIGSCFPTTIITRVLNCGLKDFCSSGTAPAERDSRKKMPKMASVVGILGHLASNHSADIRRALMNLFEESLKAEGDMVKVTTVPFLLQLASMSTMLLQVLTTDMVKALTPEVLNRLHHQFSRWKMNSPQEYNSFLNLVVHLVFRSDVGAFDVLNFLITTAAPQPSDKQQTVALEGAVQDTCVELICLLQFELQRAVHGKKREAGTSEIPLLSGLSMEVDRLLLLLLQSDGKRVPWLEKIIKFLAIYSGESVAASILSKLIALADKPSHLSIFINLQRGMEVGFPEVMWTSVSQLMDLLQPHLPGNRDRLLKNLLCLVRLERRMSGVDSPCLSSSIVQPLQHKLRVLCPLLLDPGSSFALPRALKFLSHLGIPATARTEVFMEIAMALVNTFFRVLNTSDRSEVTVSMSLCKACLRQLCGQPASQSMLLRLLLEGALSSEVSRLFGAKMTSGSRTNGERQVGNDLLEQNMNQAWGVTAMRSHSSVFHAGIIGKGLKPRMGLRLNQAQVRENVNYLLDVLWLCSGRELPPADAGEEVMEVDGMGGSDSVKAEKLMTADCISDSAGRTLGVVLVELLTLDVLYNDINWPDESFISITRERDLFTWKKLEENPLAWEILEAFCHNALFMYYCSPLLRSITATLLMHFDAVRDRSMSNSPHHYLAACRLMACLEKSELLPAPLSYIGELFRHLAPYEGRLLLSAIWKFMRENTPTYSKEEIRKRRCGEKFLQMIGTVIHSEVGKMGSLFSRFFNGSTAWSHSALT